MKRLFFILIVGLVLLGGESQACDNCNVFLSINPNDYRHNFGIQLRSRQHYGKFDNSGVLMVKHGSGEPLTYRNDEVQEFYNRIELTGNYYWSKKWNIQVIVPYIHNVEIINGFAKYNVKGIGDPWLIQNYQVYSTKDVTDSTVFRQRITLGLGLKIPLGAIDQVHPAGVPNLDLQPGTGSWDGLLNAQYVARVYQFGVLAYGTYKMNTANRDKFKYGNTINANFNVFYQWKLGKMVLMPTCGAYLEKSEEDEFSSIINEESGGQSWFVDASLSTFINKIKLQINYQQCMKAVLLDDEQLKTVNRWNFGLYYNF